jgi:hypothetical protein
MPKYLIPFLVLALIFVFFLFGVSQKEKTIVYFQNYSFEVELAQNSWQRAKGLMFKEEMDENQGMLFVFPKPGLYNFWMKNVRFPSDLIWIDQEKKIVDLKLQQQPCSASSCSAIEPKSKAQYVLELKGGMASKAGMTVGSQLKF